jgi:hypothetical protein
MTKKELIERNEGLCREVNSLIKVLIGLKEGTLKIEDVEIKAGNVSNS